MPHWLRPQCLGDWVSLNTIALRWSEARQTTINTPVIELQPPLSTNSSQSTRASAMLVVYKCELPTTDKCVAHGITSAQGVYRYYCNITILTVGIFFFDGVSHTHNKIRCQPSLVDVFKSSLKTQFPGIAALRDYPQLQVCRGCWKPVRQSSRHKALWSEVERRPDKIPLESGSLSMLWLIRQFE